ncbi:MAG: dockerin type I domain-containing protein [Thiogranum sp.]
MHKKHSNRNALFQAGLATVLITLLPASTAQAAGDTCVAGAEPLLSVADFSGDGLVNNRDLALLGRVIQNNHYIAFYDRNTDGHINARDLDLANQDLGKASSDMDRDIAGVYWGTTSYRNLGQAALDGYEPATQVVAGHGRHWTQARLFREATYPDNPKLNTPAGLNYDEDGVLQAVFWGQPTAYPTGSLPPPRIFSQSQTWHGHNQACVTNYGLIENVKYSENVDPAQCESSGGESDTFYMLHLWLYRLNPNGAFAMTHPCA